ncbi:MAG: hypothetical protein ABFD10_05285 [Prolixibacteraceae bacterium]
MKQTFFSAMLLIIIIAFFVACQGRQPKDQQKTDEPKTELQLSEELRGELIAMLEEYNTNKDNYSPIKSWEDQERILNPVYSLPLDLAEKAQTLEQKSFLLGSYLQNELDSRFFCGIDDEERQKVIGKLAVEVNLSEFMDIGKATEKTWQKLIETNAQSELTEFKTALGNGTADKFIQIILGAYTEKAYGRIIWAGSVGAGFRYQSAPGVTDRFIRMNEILIGLIEKLLPFYPALKSTEPLISDIRLLQKSVNTESEQAAYETFSKSIKEKRAAFIAGLQ